MSELEKQYADYNATTPIGEEEINQILGGLRIQPGLVRLMSNLEFCLRGLLGILLVSAAVYSGNFMEGW